MRLPRQSCSTRNCRNHQCEPVYGIHQRFRPRRATIWLRFLRPAFRSTRLPDPNYTTFLSDGQPHEYLRLNVGDSGHADSRRLSRLGFSAVTLPDFRTGDESHDDVTDIALRAVLGRNTVHAGIQRRAEQHSRRRRQRESEGHFSRVSRICCRRTRATRRARQTTLAKRSAIGQKRR